jgi:hypothetical protein
VTSPFAKPVGGGAYFTAKDHIADLALVIEPKSVARDVPNEYQGVITKRDEVTADIAVFRNSQDIESKKPSLVLKSAKITNSALTGEAEQHIGTGVPLCVVVRKGTKAYRFTTDGLTDEALAAAGEWYVNREAAVNAAVASAPGFD